MAYENLLHVSQADAKVGECIETNSKYQKFEP